MRQDGWEDFLGLVSGLPGEHLQVPFARHVPRPEQLKGHKFWSAGVAYAVKLKDPGATMSSWTFQTPM